MSASPKSSPPKPSPGEPKKKLSPNGLKRKREDSDSEEEGRPSDEIMMLNVSGTDKKGITKRVTSILKSHHGEILDINQALSHKKLMLGIMIRIPQSTDKAAMTKDLLFAAHELGLAFDTEAVSHEEYEEWVDEAGLPQWILTLLARHLTGEYLAAVSDLVVQHNLNIHIITRLSGRRRPGRDALDPSRNNVRRACVEMRLRGEVPDEARLRDELMALCSKLPIDLSFQKDDIYRRFRRLAVFDMDSTLIQHEVIDELAIEAGVGDKVAAITESAMRGEIDFRESLKQRVAMLKGLPESTLQVVADRLTLTEGAKRLIRTLRRMGFKTAILSGGFTYFAKHLQKILGFDYVYANELEIVDGVMTGRVIGEVVDAASKAYLLKTIAQQERIDPRQTIAVGDGANDLPMLSTAGLGVAFHAKPLVKKQAKHQISNMGLDGVLYLIGVSDRDVKMIQLEQDHYFSD